MNVCLIIIYFAIEHKERIDHAMLADLILFGADEKNFKNKIIMLLTTDGDFAHALHKLKQRHYKIILVVLPKSTMKNTLLSAADTILTVNDLLPATTIQDEDEETEQTRPNKKQRIK